MGRSMMERKRYWKGAALGAAANRDPLPLACVPDAIPVAERARHFELVRQLFGRVRERVRIDRGYAFRFDRADLRDVMRFLENERKCCPFIELAVDDSPGDATVWLRLTGPDGMREFLHAELPLIMKA